MQQNQNKINIIIHAKNNNDPKIDKVKIKSTVKRSFSDTLWNTVFSNVNEEVSHASNNDIKYIPKNNNFDILSLAEMGLVYKTPTIKPKNKTVNVKPLSINEVYRMI